MVCNIAEYLIYDDGSHLKKFAANICRRTATDTATRISEMAIIVDKLHFKGHKDQWCHDNCKPYNYKELEGVKF